MQEIYGSLFDSVMADAICITTNGFVNKQGACSMGKGCAGDAKHRWPGIQMTLGKLIQQKGNRVHLLTGADKVLPGYAGWAAHTLPYHLITFPTKPDTFTADANCSNVVEHMRHQATPGKSLPGWMSVSDLELIEKGCMQLVELTNTHSLESVVLPRPGVGAGQLSWEKHVRPVCEKYLDDRFYTITFEKE